MIFTGSQVICYIQTSFCIALITTHSQTAIIMKIIFYLQTFSKLVSRGSDSLFVQLSCHFVNVDVLPPVMHLENRKVYYNKYSASQSHHRWQHKPQPTGTRINLSQVV